VRTRLSNLVRRRREQLGWTQSDLARALGSSPSRICKLEGADPSVAPTLMLRALEVMESPLRIELRDGDDAFTDSTLPDEQRRALSGRLLQRRCDERIAERATSSAALIDRLRGRGDVKLSTDEIMALTRRPK
jgi:transcriptional regulator with XRE-family HTH domain